MPASGQAGAKTGSLDSETFLTKYHSCFSRVEVGQCLNGYPSRHKPLLPWSEVPFIRQNSSKGNFLSLYALPIPLGQVIRYLVRDYEADLIGSRKNFYTCCNLGGFPAEQLFGRPKLMSKSAGNLTPFSNCQHSGIISLIKIDVSTT